MKLNQLFKIALVALTVCSSLPAVASAQDNAVLLVLPSRYAVMQVGFDVARRYPTVLVSYQGSHDNPQLHVWNGYEWMPLAVEDYQSGAFLMVHPARTIFIGDDALIPPALRSINAWSASNVQFSNLEVPALINSIGQYLPFTPTDWRWFAGRYNLSLSSISTADPAADSWYGQTGPVDDPPPSFFKYFTRRERAGKKTTAPIQPVETYPGETIDTPAVLP